MHTHSKETQRNVTPELALEILKEGLKKKSSRKKRRQ